MMLRSWQSAGRGHCPRGGRARRPSRSWSGARGAVAVLLACAAPTIAGCSNGAADQVTRPVALGMTSTMAPFYSDGQLTLYQVQIAVPLPVRQMTNGDFSAAGKAPAQA